MTLTEEELEQIDVAVNTVGYSALKFADFLEIMAMARAYRDAEQSGRLLPVLPEGNRLKQLSMFDDDRWHAVLIGDSFIDLLSGGGETPAAAVTAALRGIEGA